MKTIIKVVVVIALLSLCVYIEDYVQRCAAMFVGAGIAVVGLAVGDKTDLQESWRDFIATLGVLLYFGFFLGIAMEIHVEETPDGVEIKSAYYTHVLETGERVQTKELRSNYSQYYSRWDVDTQVFYFLYNGTHCSVYNRYGKVLDLHIPFSIEAKDFGHGEINYIRIGGGQAFDMRGTEINEDYSPYVSDRTPDYNNYANL